MQFTKVQGCENDFILLDFISSLTPPTVPPKEAQIWCHRIRGIGADGILLITKNPSSQRAIMHVVNSDGSSSEMCGNGLRCVALYLKRRGWFGDDLEGKIETGGGLMSVSFSSLYPYMVTVKMPLPTSKKSFNLPSEMEGAHLNHPKINDDPPSDHALNHPSLLNLLSLGNPHAVTFNREAYSKRQRLAPIWSTAFEEGVNLSFAQLISPTEITLHVHERGCGWTRGCGTGACATAYTAVQHALSPLNVPILIHLPGGELTVEVSERDLKMSGEAAEVFTGTLSSKLLR